MAHYTVVYSCGHKGSIQLFGAGRDREWKLKREGENLCPDCYERARQERAETAQQEAKNAGWAELAGTPKQQLWAATIRKQKLEAIQGAAEGKTDSYHWSPHTLIAGVHPQTLGQLAAEAEGPYDPAKVLRALLATERMQRAVVFLEQRDQAHWWIDRRDMPASSLLMEAYKSIPEQAPSREQVELEHDVLLESTVRPQAPLTETVATVRVVAGKLEIHFPERHEKFRSIMRDTLHMVWSDTCWARTLGLFAGAPDDRVAEAGHRLLAAGFIIRIHDPLAREAAIQGTFAPEQRRWVARVTQKGPTLDWFLIRWGREEDFYSAAKALPRSRYERPNVVVPPEFFEEVLDFAEVHGFSVSKGAREIAEQARARRDATLVANVTAKPAAGQVPPPDGKPPRLDVPETVEIPDDLRDE